jgi:hypothetical protein
MRGGEIQDKDTAALRLLNHTKHVNTSTSTTIAISALRPVMSKGKCKDKIHPRTCHDFPEWE